MGVYVKTKAALAFSPHTSIKDSSMSASRALLSSSRLMVVPRRGKALVNWARPSIDEMGVPTEPWKQVHDKNQSKFTIQLLAGVGLMGASLFAFSQSVFMNPPPTHLLKN